MGSEASAITVRAAAVLFHGEALLVQRRRGDSVWALPGGGVKPGESAAAAVVRELAEELAEHVEVQRLVFLAENFFAHNGRTQHELGFYFLASLQQRSALPSRCGPFAGFEREADLEFCWFPRHELTGIGLRPSFLVSALAVSPLEFRHVVVGRSQTVV
jgi:ADP-ribose pyrophosphatase YjhB (NUDIX family)